jgi:signal peptidase II
MTKSEEADIPKAEQVKPEGSWWARFEPKWKIFWLVGLISLVADQITKIWARASLPVHPSGCEIPQGIMQGKCMGMPVEVIKGYWDWRLSMNPGSAFGLFGSFGADFTRWFLSAIGIGAVVGMGYMLKKSRTDQKILHWALALVAGGAVGNLIDRMWFGQVTDFVLWRYKTHQWPVFNIADVVLVVGVGLMFIDIHKENKREKILKEARIKKAKEQGLVKDLSAD